MRRNNWQALGRMKKGVMNKTEAEYAGVLEQRKAKGEIQEYWFEGITLHLAKLTSYRPDFLILLPDGRMIIHEVKGLWRDDSKAKTKIAAEKFPFPIVIVKKQAKKNGGGWEYEEF